MTIVTDTASDILESEAAELDIRLAPLDIAFGDVHCSRNTPEMLDEFYRLLTTSEEFPKTSQPAPEIWLELFREAQENNEAMRSGDSFMPFSSQRTYTLNRAPV